MNIVRILENAALGADEFSSEYKVKALGHGCLRSMQFLLAQGSLTGARGKGG
jgi:hypothetical protein